MKKSSYETGAHKPLFQQRSHGNAAQAWTYLFLFLLVWKQICTWQATDIPLKTFNQANGKSNHAFQHNGSVHNITIDCGNWTQMKATLLGCERNLIRLYPQGYPWSLGNRHRSFSSSNLKDSLDSLDETCHIAESSRTCREQSGITDYCLGTVAAFVKTEMEFHFICLRHPRDENLIRSLQCLRDTRVLVMLHFHIGNRCFQGMDMLDDLMARMNNAYFYKCDVPVWEPIILQFACFPKQVIFTCIRTVIDEHCVAMTAELVQDYLLYLREWVGRALQSAGLPFNICESDSPFLNRQSQTYM